MAAQDPIIDTEPTETGVLANSFRSFNRGILTAFLYSAAVLVGVRILLGATIEAWVLQVLFGLMGFVAGAIAGFSNTDEQVSQKRDLIRNALDAAMVTLWTTLILFAVNLTMAHYHPTQLLVLVGIFGAGTLLGGLVGEPVLTLLGQTTIKGVQPFLFLNRLTEGISNADAKFILRVVLQTVLFAILVAIAFALFIVFLVIVALVISLFIIGKILSDDSEGKGRVFLPKGHKIRESDGRIVREGIIFDDETGVRVKREGGKRRLVQEGAIFDHDTGIVLDEKNRPKKEHLFGEDEDVSVVVTEDGKVFQAKETE